MSKVRRNLTTPKCSVAVAALLAAIACAISITTASPEARQTGCEPPDGNPIVCENLRPGSPSSEWDISGAGDPSIQGFATDISVGQGETVTFKIDTDAAAYQLDIYRLGYYAGLGARKVATVTPFATLPQNQPTCLTDSTTGLIDCGNWAPSAAWTVPADAVSGIYLAKATRTDTGGASHIVFVVRDDDGASDLLFQTSDTTWQAYNRYGGNSLYVGEPAGRAYKVSYNRPFTTREYAPEDWLFNAEYPMVRWLEENGYNVSYFTGVDADRRGAEILEHKVFLSVGHDEYWSGTQRTAVEAARAAGVHLAFFSGNEIFWKTRWEPSIAAGGGSHRTLVTYKETHDNLKIDPSGEWTGTWADPRFSPPSDGGRPQNALTGQLFTVNCCTSAIEVPAAMGRLRFWRNTSIATLPAGAVATLPDGTLGYEWDEDIDNGFRPAGSIRLSNAVVSVPQRLQDYGSTYAPGTARHTMTLYRHASGAIVFGAGTVQWSWGLDGTHDRGTSEPSRDMRQATVNLLADMGVQPLTIQPDLVPGSPSTDLDGPITIVTSPLEGAVVPQSATITITGTATDVGGGVVGAVEVSLDGGSSWRRATGTENWSYSWQTGTPRTVSILARAADDSGNLGLASAPFAVTVGTEPIVCPCSIWGATQVPTNAAEQDSNAVELGLKFRSSVNGYATGVRFFKSAQNVGVHTGSLWTATGQLLETATFESETASGWQQVTFANPVEIAADTTYVVSYHTNSGFYAQDARYFSEGPVVNGPLTALADGTDGGNGIYTYGPGGFPSTPADGSNYWVDVVFTTTVGPDVTAPTIRSRIPAAGASGVSALSPIKVVFSERIDPSTLTSATFELRDAGGNLVAGTISWDPIGRTATFDPAAPLALSTAYSATLKGGAAGIKDLAGNALAADSTWSFTTAGALPPNPTTGPGGPILVVSSPSNPFSTYYAEILRAEGFNSFEVLDVSALSAEVLAGFDVVILGEIPLTDAQVSLLSGWVGAGGNLIAMRPDKKLASLLGLADAGATIDEGYLLINTETQPGAGLVGGTIQYHGRADAYSLAGATAVATLYSDATTPTTHPAVTTRQVGESGGSAVAFTYDLARSIVYTRQGNPAWSGQERDGFSPIRSNDLFFGGSEPDYVDLNKVAIPQADEQQRLLANLINHINADRKPLPRFWYLPRGLKAAVVMTGDDHASNGTQGQFNRYLAASPEGCSVDDWECVRATSYIYPHTPLPTAQAEAFAAAGFEIGAHISTGCGDYTPESIGDVFAADLSQFATNFPALPPPATNRTHCIAWSDYTSQAEVELAHGIRLDTNYYYWPDVWVNDRPGLFTGSGFPMRFAKTDGTMIDVYQAATAMTDESGQTFPDTIDVLLDRALGPQGYYGAFVANMHTDASQHSSADLIVASARARGVPVISAQQLLTWLDGRNASSFDGLVWNGGQLEFTIEAASGARGLQALLPYTAASGRLMALTRDGTNVPFTVETIKGVTYAVFPAQGGGYRAVYAEDDTPPLITAVSVSVSGSNATISWTTSEPATSVVSYGTSPDALTHTATAAGLNLSHSISIAGLAAGQVYFYQVTSADDGGNSSSAPNPPGVFATVGVDLIDTTVADFSAGSLDANTTIVPVGDGAVMLRPAVGEEFAGTALPVGWSSTAWSADGTHTVAGGSLQVDGAKVATDALFGPGRSLEFEATFNGTASQHAGLADSLDAAPWAIFSTFNGNGLYARTNTGSEIIDTPIAGIDATASHRFRIDWLPSSITFSVDGVVVATHPVSLTADMRVAVSDLTAGDGALAVDWLRLSPYAASGVFASRILDAGARQNWSQMSWTTQSGAGGTLAMEIRFGDTPAPDATWTSFAAVPASGSALTGVSRYAQYRAVFSGGGVASPVLESVMLSTGGPAPEISLLDATVVEGPAGSVNATVAVTLSHPSLHTIQVSYATANGSGFAAADYVPVSGTLTFAPGTVTGFVNVPINGDAIAEEDETVFVDFSNPSNAYLTRTRAVVTVLDDDGPVDAGEPDNSVAGARALVPGIASSSYLSSSGDEDWYRLVIQKDTHVQIRLTVPGSVDYGIELHGPTSLLGASDSAGPGIQEELLTTLAAGTYHVKVRTSNGYSKLSPYVLRVVASTFSDSFEPNNTLESAVTIGTMPYESKIYTPADVDWYRFRTSGTGAVALNLVQPAGTALRLELYTGAGGLISSASGGGTVTETLSAGSYAVKVITQGGHSTSLNYRLSISGATVVNPGIENVILGLGKFRNDGGWVATHDGAESAFGLHTWLRLPWVAYNAKGGGVRVATGDVDGDGADEIVIGVGAGGGGFAAILDDAARNHALITWIHIDWPTYVAANGEVFPAVGDLDGDGFAEIVLGLGKGANGWYQVFASARGNFRPLAWKQVPWVAYNASFGSTHPAVGDVDGDGIAEIIVGLGKGSGGWLQVADGAASGFAHRGWLQLTWSTYVKTEGTTYPAVGDVDGDGRAEVVVGLGPTSEGWFEVFDDAVMGFRHLKWDQVTWPSYNAYSGETHPAVGNIDGDPAAEIVLGLAEYPANGGWFEVRDDAAAGYRSLWWQNLGWGPFKADGGALFPAVAGRR